MTSNTKQGCGLSMDVEEVEALREGLRRGQEREDALFDAVKAGIARWKTARTVHCTNPTEDTCIEYDAAFVEWLQLWDAYETIHLARRGVQRHG